LAMSNRRPGSTVYTALSRAELFGRDPGISVRIKRWRAERRRAPNNQAIAYPKKPARNSIRLALRVRRFFCDNPSCSRAIFVERLGAAILAYARRTSRLNAQLQVLAQGLVGQAGQWSSKRSACR